MDKLIIPEGSVLQWQGMPVQLERDTVVLGNRANFDMATNDLARRSKNHGSWWSRLCYRREG